MQVIILMKHTPSPHSEGFGVCRVGHLVLPVVQILQQSDIVFPLLPHLTLLR